MSCGSSSDSAVTIIPAFSSRYCIISAVDIVKVVTVFPCLSIAVSVEAQYMRKHVKGTFHLCVNSIIDIKHATDLHHEMVSLLAHAGGPVLRFRSLTRIRIERIKARCGHFPSPISSLSTHESPPTGVSYIGSFGWSRISRGIAGVGRASRPLSLVGSHVFPTRKRNEFN